MIFKDHERELLLQFVQYGIEFVVVGGAAVALHGHDRERQDLDVLICPERRNVHRLQRVDLNWYRFKPHRIEVLTRPPGNLRCGVRGVDVLSEIAGVATDVAIREQVVISVDGLDVPTISKKNLIAAKRAAGEEKDLEDVEALIAL